MGGDPTFPPGSTTTTTQTTITTTQVTTPLAGIANGQALLGQLLTIPSRPQSTRVRRSARAQAAYARRVARLSPTARKRLVLRKYRIAPRGWLAFYLPQDRYKFSKAWKFVSTETDRFYYRPQDMPRRRFNPNRVIGFRTWQDAMLAGYRPDPASKPAPGNQFAYFARLTRDEPLVRYLEYAYAGQVSPSSLDATYNYVRRVKAVIDRNPHVRRYQRSTVNSILQAALTGDTSLIPTVLGETAPMAVPGAGGQPQFPNAAGAGGRPGAGPMGNPGGPPPGFRPPTGPPPGATPPSRGMAGNLSNASAQ